MANTLLTDVSPDGRIALSGSDEKYIAAFGDGTAKPGDAVGKVGATGKVVQCDIGASEMFIGFLMANRSDSTLLNVGGTAMEPIADGVPCTIVKPQSAHDYACLIVDPAGDEFEGQPYGFSATAGALDDLAALGTAGCVAYLAKDVANGDLYGIVSWK